MKKLTKKAMEMASSYFAIRRLEIESLLSKEVEMNRYKEELNRLYRQMERDVQGEIDKYLARYARATDQTIDEAIENISEVDLRDYREHVERYRIDKSPEAMKRLNINFPSLQHTRLQLTQKRIAVITVAAADIENKRLATKLGEEYKKEYVRRLDQMDDVIDMSTSSAHIERLAKAAAKQKHYGQHFSSRIWQAQAQASGDLQNELSNVISRSISLGENPNKNAHKLQQYVQETVENKAYAARRLAHTETQNVQFEASNDMFKEYVEDQVEGMEATYDWLPEKDERTCSICTDLGAGGPYTMDEIESIGTPHPFCRCAYTISSTYLKELRKARGL